MPRISGLSSQKRVKSSGVLFMIAHIDDNQLSKVIYSYNETERVIIEGSDEHLDLILDIKGDLTRLTSLTEELVNQIEKDFNAFTIETAKDAVVKLFPIFRIAYHIVQRLRHNNLTNGLETTIADFIGVVDELKEFVSDLERYKIQSTDELTELFQEKK